jgi:hypothetical protein
LRCGSSSLYIRHGIIGFVGSRSGRRPRTSHGGTCTKLEYNQKNFLRLIPASLLARYFEKRRALREIDWESDPEVDQINDALMALQLEERQGISVDFQNVHRLASCYRR